MNLELPLRAPPEIPALNPRDDEIDIFHVHAAAADRDRGWASGAGESAPGTITLTA